MIGKAARDGKGTKFHFTYLSLIVEFVQQQMDPLIEGPNVQISQPRINQQQDICLLRVDYPAPSTSGDQQQCSLVCEIRILQIENIIKFHSSIKKCKHGQWTVDVEQFWLNARNYVNKVPYTSLQLCDAKANASKHQQLTSIINQRLIRPIQAHLPHPQSDSNTQNHLQELLLKTASINFLTLSRYLNPREYINLQLCSRQLYRTLHTQRNYKIMLESAWGKTGFELDQKDWVKMYRAKLLAQHKGKPKIVTVNGFRWV